MVFLEVLCEFPKARVVFSHYDPPWRRGKKGIKQRSYSASVHTKDHFGNLDVVHFQADLFENITGLVQLYLDNIKTIPANPAIIKKVSGAELEAFLE